MRLLHWNRRIHLYLALALLPWFLLYGVSSFAFSHGAYFEEVDKARNLPGWIPVAERTNYEMPPSNGNLRVFADAIVKDVGLNTGGAYGAYRPNAERIDVYYYTFWKSTQVKCFLAEKRLVVEDKRFRWDHFLTGMHAKGGFENGGLHDAWAVLVDLVSLGMLLWVITGLVMWWMLPQTRNWGWLALAAGLSSFAIFLLRL